MITSEGILSKMRDVLVQDMCTLPVEEATIVARSIVNRPEIRALAQAVAESVEEALLDEREAALGENL